MGRDTVETSMILNEKGFIDISVNDVGLVTFKQRSTNEVLFKITIEDLAYILENAEDAYVDLGGEL